MSCFSSWLDSLSVQERGIGEERGGLTGASTIDLRLTCQAEQRIVHLSIWRQTLPPLSVSRGTEGHMTHVCQTCVCDVQKVQLKAVHGTQKCSATTTKRSNKQVLAAEYTRPCTLSFSSKYTVPSVKWGA